MARMLERALRREGHSVLLAYDGGQALSIGRSEELDVILLDAMLPVIDGFEVVRGLREAKRNTPTIMVTALDSMTDVVRGLDAGADDYLTKPFALDVLLARIRAVSRRGPMVHPAFLQFLDLQLNAARHELTRGCRSTPLTRTEFALLELLMRRAGMIVTHDMLLETGWGVGAEVSDSTLYVFIRALRAKIAVADEPQYLQTARGVGYTLRHPGN